MTQPLKHPHATLLPLNAMPQDSFDPSLLSQELAPLVRTPRCHTFKKEEAFLMAQKPQNLLASRTQKDKLPHLTRQRTDLKENLLDMDLCFEMDPSEFCDSQTGTERQSFIIRKLRTPSVSSKGKRTATGSNESSIELPKVDYGTKNTTDMDSSKRRETRGRSQCKPAMTCRIVNSKKLPFDLHSQRQRKVKPSLEQQNLEVSVILGQKSSEPLFSQESFEDLCQYF